MARNIGDYRVNGRNQMKVYLIEKVMRINKYGKMVN
jgi:hypothetical protein